MLSDAAAVGARCVNHQRRFDRQKIALSEDYIHIDDGSIEMNADPAEVQRIIEVPNAIYIRLKGNNAIIMPKNQIGDIQRVQHEVRGLATY